MEKAFSFVFIPSSPAYGVFISQLIRYARASTKSSSVPQAICALAEYPGSYRTISGISIYMQMLLIGSLTNFFIQSHNCLQTSFG